MEGKIVYDEVAAQAVRDTLDAIERCFSRVEEAIGNAQTVLSNTPEAGGNLGADNGRTLLANIRKSTQSIREELNGITKMRVSWESIMEILGDASMYPPMTDRGMMEWLDKKRADVLHQISFELFGGSSGNDQDWIPGDLLLGGLSDMATLDDTPQIPDGFTQAAADVMKQLAEKGYLVASGGWKSVWKDRIE